MLLLLPVDPAAVLTGLVIESDTCCHLGVRHAAVLHFLVADFLVAEPEEGDEDGADEDDKEDDDDDHSNIDGVCQVWRALLHHLPSEGHIRQEGARTIERLDLIVHSEVHQTPVESWNGECY